MSEIMKAVLVLATFALAVPGALALPVVCGASCEIGSDSDGGYDPLVMVVASGSSVTWTSEDITHISRDVAAPGDDPCFFVGHEPDVPSPAVRFDIQGGAVVATVDGETLPCTGAVGGAAVYTLHYYCALHPVMRAQLVVTGTSA